MSSASNASALSQAVEDGLECYICVGDGDRTIYIKGVLPIEGYAGTPKFLTIPVSHEGGLLDGHGYCNLQGLSADVVEALAEIYLGVTIPPADPITRAAVILCLEDHGYDVPDEIDYIRAGMDPGYVSDWPLTSVDAAKQLLRDIEESCYRPDPDDQAEWLRLADQGHLPGEPLWYERCKPPDIARMLAELQRW